MSLDPQAALILEQIKQVRPLPLNKLTLIEARNSYLKMQAMAGEPEQVGQIEDRTIPVEDGEIKIRIYRPYGNGPFPILLYFHGGGWVLGDLEIADRPCRSLANLANCIIVSVDYRLAPEYKFPTAVNDCYSALEWTVKNAEFFEGDKKRIAVGGDSAGGNLAAAVTLKARDEKSIAITFQLLIYPVTDLTSFNTPSYKENASGYYLTTDNMLWYKRHYLANSKDANHIYASPLLKEDLSDLPPALIITAEYDPLRDEGEAYAKRLKQHGVSTEYVCFKGMIHGFFYMGGIIDKGKEAIELSASRIKATFNSSFKFKTE